MQGFPPLERPRQHHPHVRLRPDATPQTQDPQVASVLLQSANVASYLLDVSPCRGAEASAGLELTDQTVE